MSEYVTLLPPRVRHAKRCACGCSYDALAWAALNRRQWRLDDIWMEVAECTAVKQNGEVCNSTIAVELEP